jgi:hypothetical protein
MKNRFQNLPFKFQLAALQHGKMRCNLLAFAVHLTVGLCRLNQVDP